MTLISHRAKFIFLKTFKTASTSIEVALEPLCLPEGAPTGAHYREASVTEAGIVGARGQAVRTAEWRAHMSARAVKRQIGDDIWRRYTKITVVRNPFDRMVSQFFFGQTVARRAELAKSFTETKAAFRTWLRDADVTRNRNKLFIGLSYQPDHVLFYENLEADFAALLRGLGEIPRNLPCLKADSRVRPEPWAAFYDEESRRIIETASGFEMAYFGYSFSGGPAPGAFSDRFARLLRASPQHILAARRKPRMARFTEVEIS